MPPLVMIPSWWWKSQTENEQCDYRAELLACLDTAIDHQAPPLAPLTLGALSSLELIDSLCWHDPDHAPHISWARAAVIINERYQAVEYVKQFIVSGNQDSPAVNLNLALDIHAGKFIQKYFKEFDSHLEQLKINFKTQIAVAVSGMKMIPVIAGKPYPDNEYLFGSTFIMSHAARACELLNVSRHDAIWNTPLAAITIAEALDFARNDPKDRGISRPKDRVSGDKVMRECEARAEKGELQPWQIIDPKQYPPSPDQIKINPDIMTQYTELLNGKT